MICKSICSGPKIRFYSLALRVVISACFALELSGCAHRQERVDDTSKIDIAPPTQEWVQSFEVGMASWYGARFQGKKMANGQRFDMHRLSAAHRSLPFGTVVRVRSMKTGREVEVKITDRGPFTKGRVIDVSYAAAKVLGILGTGVERVEILMPRSDRTN